MSDSSSDEAAKPKAKAKATGRPAVESDSDSEVRPAPKVKAVVEDSDSDDVPQAKAVTKVKAPAKAAVPEDSDSSDEDRAPPVRKIEEKVKVVAAPGDDSDDSDDEAVAGKDAKGKGSKVTSKAKLEAASGKPSQDAATSSKPKGEDDTDELRVFITGLPWKINEDIVRKDFFSCGQIKHVKVPSDEQGKTKGIAFVTFKTSAGVEAALKIDGDKEKYKGRTLKIVRAMKNKGPKKEDPKDASKKKDMSKEEIKRSKEEKKKQRKMGLTDLDAPTPGPSAVIDMKMIEKMLNAQKTKDFQALEAFGQKIASRAKKAMEEKLKEKEDSKTKVQKEVDPHTVFVTGLPATDFNEEAFRRRFQDCGDIKYIWMPVRKSSGENKGFGKIAFKNDESFQKAMKYTGTKCKGSLLTVVKSGGADKGAEPQKEESSKRKAAAPEEGTVKKKSKTATEEVPAEHKKKNKNASEELPEGSDRKSKSQQKTKVAEEDLEVKKKAKKVAN